MELIFLGTATSQGIPVIGCDCDVCSSTNPHNQRKRSSVLLSYNNRNYLIDAGPDLRQQMLNFQVHALEAVLLTHEHADHTNGLDDLRPFIFRQKKDMPIYALPRVVQDIKERFAYAFQPNPYPGIPRFDMRTFNFNEEVIIDGLTIEILKIHHGKLSIAGFKIGDLVYITDAKSIDTDQIERIRGIDTLIINALHHAPHYTHFNLEEALEAIEKINPRRAFLTHISHKMGDCTQVTKTLPNHVSLAYDGLNLKV